MNAYRLTMEEEPAEADLEIFTELRDYNESHVGPSGHRNLTIFLRDFDGAVVGGLKGSTSRGWLHISLLVVRKELRHQGWGRQLLAAAEHEALQRGCRHAYLETFSFQALPFYRKYGYVVFGTLNDYPPGHACHFLCKRLTSETIDPGVARPGDRQEPDKDQHDEFESLIAAAEAQPFSGWNFTYLTGRWEESEPSWNYRQSVTDLLPQAVFMLDMGTGGGEFLASLFPLPLYTCATEGYKPNLGIARERLAPLGIAVMAIEADGMLPFPDDTFDMVINRHEAFVAAEVFRVLRPGGLFVTQQVGGLDNIRLNRWLQAEVYKEDADWSLQTAVQELSGAGFTVMRQMEEFPETLFFDIGAIVYYLKAIPWQIPGFSPSAFRVPLRSLADAIQKDGYFAVNSHRFYIEAQKPLVQPDVSESSEKK